MYCVTNSLGLILVYRNNGKNLRTHTLYQYPMYTNTELSMQLFGPREEIEYFYHRRQDSFAVSTCLRLYLSY